ncbi:hypothetical protein ABD76_03560 [Paenibacillus dendritiformis]|nr:hypothetical protein [Paenibacillus dendritiformis]
MLLASEVVYEMEPHASEPLQGDVLFLHHDSRRESAKTQPVCNDPGIDAVGFVQVGISVFELVNQLWIDGEHLGIQLLKGFILMQIHGRMPTVDGCCFEDGIEQLKRGNLADGALQMFGAGFNFASFAAKAASSKNINPHEMLHTRFKWIKDELES